MFNRFCLRAMLIIFALILLAAIGAGLALGMASFVVLAAALVLAAGMWFLLPPISGLLGRLGALRCFLLLSALCLAVKGGYILLVRVPLSGDAETFYNYACALAGLRPEAGWRYMALFPHIYGYSAFLGVFVRLLGEAPLLAQWLNVLLSLLAGACIYRLCLRELGLRQAVSAYLLWILCPSQTMFNSLAISEPLYTALLLCIVLLCSALASARGGTAKWLAAGVLGGLLLRYFNLCRPIAAILVVALLLWLLFLEPKRLSDSGGKRWLAFLAAALVVSAVSGPLIDARLEAMLGEPPARAVGYNMYVGLNESSGGAWNAEDSALLDELNSEAGSTAVQIQEQFQELSKQRAAQIQDWPGFLLRKLGTLIGTDSGCVEYSLESLEHPSLFSAACTGFYWACILMAALNCVLLLRRAESSVLMLLPIYAIGLVLAQMLVEVAGRYHYSLIPAILVMAVYRGGNKARSAA